jgi:hypothetical protein
MRLQPSCLEHYHARGVGARRGCRYAFSGKRNHGCDTAHIMSKQEFEAVWQMSDYKFVVR